MHCEGKLKLRLRNTSYCEIKVVTKAGLAVSVMFYSWNFCYCSTGIHIIENHSWNRIRASAVYYYIIHVKRNTFVSIFYGINKKKILSLID
jgi:branched-subunit amino acid transport protein AzlD